MEKVDKIAGLAKVAVAATRPGWLQSISGMVHPYLGTRAIEWVQSVRCGPLDAWFKYCPMLGNKEYYVLMLPFLSWYASVDTCRRFAFMAFYAAFLNNCVKDMLKLPRPPKRLQLIAHDGDTAQQPGFPSTHSADALAQVWVLAHEFYRLWYPDQYQGHGATFELPRPLLIFAGLHLLHIVVSRLYLGAHYMADIWGGLVCGAMAICQADVFFYGASAAGGASHDEWAVNSLFGQLWAVVGVCALLVIVYPEPSPSNTAFTEVVDFAAIFAGMVLGSGPAAISLSWPALPVADAPPAGVAMGVVGFVAGLAGLGIVDLILGKGSKMVVKAMGLGGTHADSVRRFVAGALLAWWVATNPVPQMVAAQL